MTDTPTPRKPTLAELATAVATVVKEAGCPDMFLMLCGPNDDASHSFENHFLVDGDARKLVPTLANFLRAKMSQPMLARLIELIQTEPTQTGKWLN